MYRAPIVRESIIASPHLMLHDRAMRTTLDIDDDVLAAAKDLARHQNRTAGEVISELARRALTGAAAHDRVAEAKPVYGFQPFPSNGKVVTNDVIDELRDRDGT
jgi:Arc/MetJ family transcription regulator